MGGAAPRAWALITPWARMRAGLKPAADLVGDEGGGTPVAVGQGQLEDAPGLPLELAQALLLGQVRELLEARPAPDEYTLSRHQG